MPKKEKGAVTAPPFDFRRAWDWLMVRFDDVTEAGFVERPALEHVLGPWLKGLYDKINGRLKDVEAVPVDKD